jgi:hypothetical protein
MNGPAPSSTPAAQPRLAGSSQAGPSRTGPIRTGPGLAGAGNSRISAVTIPPISTSRYPQPIQAGDAMAVMPPWSATCTAATATASSAPVNRTANSGAAPRAPARTEFARPATVSCVIFLPCSSFGPPVCSPAPARHTPALRFSIWAGERM